MQAARRPLPLLLGLLAAVLAGEGEALRAREDGSLGGHRRRGDPESRQKQPSAIARAQRSLAEAKAKTRKSKAAAAHRHHGEGPGVAAAKQGSGTQLRREDFKDNPFSNILLVVHCRLRGHLPMEICKQREPLFEGYKQFFPDVLYLTNSNCQMSPTNPHSCLAHYMQTRGAGRDGLFYMHFDALIKPRRLGLGFNKDAMGVFSDPIECGINDNGTQVVGCLWNLWSLKRAQHWRNAVYLVRKGSGELASLDDMHFYLGNDDLFYIPRSLFGLYGPVAMAFESNLVHHEMAGPAIRNFLHEITGVPLVNLKCTGGCCTDLQRYDALSPDFRCGHQFNLNDTDIREAVAGAISLRSTSSMVQLRGDGSGVPQLWSEELI
mmetsp:Transcript_29511/g.84494  ORF Transcript_29511/g.84494 Transcript_29511/m.84494 type:complete len:378 (-) Transcript_29511:107-1240(-)